MKKVTQDQLVLVFAIMLFIGILLYVYNQGRRKGTTIADIGDDYVRPGFNPSVLVQDGHDILTKFATGANARDEYFRRLNELSDGELKTVYNAYNDRYFKKDKKTFVQVIKDAWFTVVFGTSPKTLVLERFERMQLA